MRRHFESAHDEQRPGIRLPRVRALVPLRREHACARSTRCSRRRASRQRHLGSRRLSAAYRAAGCAARAWSKSGSRRSPTSASEIEGWDAPFDTVSETSPRVKLARRIARTVRGLVDRREPVGIERRAARYGDVLVLVRQRGELFEAIIRALKNENVEVAGADRLVLTEHIAVMDLMALADALLLPAGRSGAGDRAAQPAVRLRRRSVRHRLGPRPRLAARGAGAQRRPRRINSPKPPRGSMSWRRPRGARRRLRSTRSCSAPAARGGASWRGSASKPTMRSTNSSISRSTTSGARRPRCKASSPGCATRAPRSSATWRSRATKCAS